MQNQMQIRLDLLSETEIAYIAGILDGEGSIHISLTNQGTFLQRLGISNTNKNLIRWLNRKIGSDYIHSFKYKKRRTCYSLCFEKRERVEILLKTFLPFLIVKRKQAEVMLEYIALRQQHLKPNDPYTNRELTLYLELKKLNRRGKKIKG
jgi:hypothetical protein